MAAPNSMAGNVVTEAMMLKAIIAVTAAPLNNRRALTRRMILGASRISRTSMAHLMLSDRPGA